MMPDPSRATVQTQFGASADAYAVSDIHARGESLAALIQTIQPRRHWQALDVATGAGHTALACAPHVARVIAMDVTVEMLLKTAQLAARRGIGNVETGLADAEALPFRAGSFDLVTCRLAFHHFAHPQQAIDEFARVLKPGGMLGFTDNIVLPDETIAQYYNAFERLRDPSHQRVFSLDRLQAMLRAAGFRIRASSQLSKEFEFHEWADRQHVPAIGKETLLEMIRRAPPALRELLGPRWADGTVYFSLWEAVVVASKASQRSHPL